MKGLQRLFAVMRKELLQDAKKAAVYYLVNRVSRREIINKQGRGLGEKVNPLPNNLLLNEAMECI